MGKPNSHVAPSMAPTPLPTHARVRAHARVSDPWTRVRTFRRAAMQLRRMANSDGWRRARRMEVTFVAGLLRACERAVLSGQAQRRKEARGRWSIEDSDGTATMVVEVPARNTFADFRLATKVTYLCVDRLDVASFEHWMTGIVRGPVRPTHRARAAGHGGADQ